MSQLQHENPFENVGSRVIDALGEFDKERGELYDTLSTIAIEAPDQSTYQLSVSEQITKVALAMQDLAYELLKAEGVDDSKEQLSQLWKADDNERVVLFKDLANCVDDCFEELEDDRAVEMVDELYADASDENDLSEEIFDKYRLFLSGDIYDFVQHIQNKHEIQKDEAAPHVVKDIVIDIQTIRRAALGMATVALGVAGGLVLDRVIRKHHSQV